MTRHKISLIRSLLLTSLVEDHLQVASVSVLSILVALRQVSVHPWDSVVLRLDSVSFCKLVSEWLAHMFYGSSSTISPRRYDGSSRCLAAISSKRTSRFVPSLVLLLVNSYFCMQVVHRFRLLEHQGVSHHSRPTVCPEVSCRHFLLMVHLLECLRSRLMIVTQVVLLLKLRPQGRQVVDQAFIPTD